MAFLYKSRPEAAPGGILLQIDGGVHAVDVALVQLPAQQLEGLPEPLEVDDLPLPEELDHVVHIGIIG